MFRLRIAPYTYWRWGRWIGFSSDSSVVMLLVHWIMLMLLAHCSPGSIVFGISLQWLFYLIFRSRSDGELDKAPPTGVAESGPIMKVTPHYVWGEMVITLRRSVWFCGKKLHFYIAIAVIVIILLFLALQLTRGSLPQWHCSEFL